ncbi:GNAT family N-acetyltransferase [Nonomuraea sp. NPDC050310]|uniref:GNAT family N-acetyltransferase n=1 Tax=unclassified Nonomuraea TaxID=2593643 RepID=UPI0033D9B164
MGLEVTDAPERSRFEITLDGELAGFAEYQLRGTTVVFTHTEVFPEHEGQGLAGKLVKHALDVSRDTGLTVRPLCPYISRFIERHPEYKDLLAPA